MSSTIDQMAKSLQTIIDDTNDRKPSPYDTEAEVVKVEGDVAWVKIPGGVDETPVRKTIDAKEGDSVQVRVSGGRAWLTGNSTAPPTDDTLAQAGYDEARTAKQLANSAKDAATVAWKYADSASRAAASAETSANEAKASAQVASEDATRANNFANSALDQLGVVEDVLDTLSWIEDHGYMTKCTDTSVVPNKIYYSVQGLAIATPTGNPSKNKYYEFSSEDDEYFLSTDTTVQSGKTYYELIRSQIADPIGNPSANGYYELTVDEAISDYVATHLALTDMGLWLLPTGGPDSSISKVLISASGANAGITLYDETGMQVAHYGTTTTIGDLNGYSIQIVANESTGKIAFKWQNQEVAYISKDQLFINKTVVVSEMQLNEKWVWSYDTEDESIFLKWIGD